MDTYTEEGIAARLHSLGKRLASGVTAAAAGMGVADHVLVPGAAGEPCSPRSTRS